MNKIIFIELANTWKKRAEIVANVTTENPEASEANKKAADILNACTNDLLNVIKMFDTFE